MKLREETTGYFEEVSGKILWMGHKIIEENAYKFRVIFLVNLTVIVTLLTLSHIYTILFILAEKDGETS